MSSIPPPARRSTPPPALRLPEHGEPRLFFSLEGAPPQACVTQATHHSISFDTTVAGLVQVPGPQELELLGEARVSLRHMLPMDLSPWQGHWLLMRLQERFAGGRWTRHLEVRDIEGRPLLIARDGVLPRDGDVLGLALRVSMDGDETRLAVGRHPHGRAQLLEVSRPIRLRGLGVQMIALWVTPEEAALLWLP